MTHLGKGVCNRCETSFTKKRQDQAYCSTRCRVADAVKRHRGVRSDYAATLVPRSDYTPVLGQIWGPQ
jgi:hypothetical protein